MLVMTAAGLEMGSRVIKRVLPIEKITSYLLDHERMARDYQQINENLDLREQYDQEVENDPYLKQVLADFEEIQIARQSKIEQREVDMFKKSSVFDYHEMFKR